LGSVFYDRNTITLGLCTNLVSPVI